FKRALVRVLKGTFSKPKGRLYEAKRACVGFEVCENSLQKRVGESWFLLFLMELYDVHMSLIFLLSSCLGLKFGVAVTLLLLRQASLFETKINLFMH
ncbi:hypothetical protein, partial [Prevotella melaninogenica]|uniref:hypothetical protein n=1 Tax=Prevotella melaninogenica TaxID=28132 RepID=UPI003C74E717